MAVGRTPRNIAAKRDEVMRKFMSNLATNRVLGVFVAGVGCGVLAFCYSTILDIFIDLTWHVFPENLVRPALEKFGWPEKNAWMGGLWILTIPTLFGLIVGASQSVLGAPGDMPETVDSFNKNGYVDYTQALSMLVVSLFSVCAGGSLGPEAPLLTLCASLVGFIYKEVVVTKKKLLRQFSLMGMGAGLAAFFGASMGGSLFALEVPHRMGLEYYEAVPYTLAAGMLCLAVFRALAGTHFGQLWPFPGELLHLDVRHILLGVALGVLGAGISYVWIKFTKGTKMFLKKNFKLDEHKTPVPCGVIGGFILGIIGMLLPPTMFWGEFELKSWAIPSIPLAHVWPQSGIWGDEPFLENNPGAGMHLLLGVAKLFAITVTLCAGFRGGFIFPLITAGASIGTAIHLVCVAWFPSIMDDFPLVVFAMCLAAAINCAITRTPLATPLILSTLSGHGICSAPCLAAALTALFLTQNVVMIGSQTARKFDELDEDSLDDDTPTEDDNHLDSVMAVDSVHQHLMPPQPRQPTTSHVYPGATNHVYPGATSHVYPGAKLEGY